MGKRARLSDGTHIPPLNLRDKRCHGRRTLIRLLGNSVVSRDGSQLLGGFSKSGPIRSAAATQLAVEDFRAKLRGHDRTCSYVHM